MNDSKKKRGSTNISSHRDLVILLAEDDDGHAELTLTALRDAGVPNEVVRFRDGTEVISFFMEKGKDARALQGTPYLLLLDLHMPQMDGFAVLSHLKKDAVFRKIPVITLTTTDDPAVIERCYTLGCNNYVTKPVKCGELSEKMKKLGLFLTIVEVPNL